MIGVIARESDRDIVQEFFHLFKTPWEFYRPGSRYDVVIASSEIGEDPHSSVVMIYGSEPGRLDVAGSFRKGSPVGGVKVVWREKGIPIYGETLIFERSGDPLIRIEGTNQPVGVKRNTNGRTILRIGFDLFREIDFLLRCGQPVEHARIPTLELHIAMLRDLILMAGVPLVEIPPVPAGHAFIACLTHDVDFAGIRRHKIDSTLFGFLSRALFGSVIRVLKGDLVWRKLWKNWLAVFSLPLVWVGIAKDFMVPFDRYVEIEGALPSTFFFIPVKNKPGRCRKGEAPRKRASKYDVTELECDICRLASKGKEVALHGIDAWLDVEAGREELMRVKETFTGATAGVRMHWLYFSQQSPAILEKAGFAYDSTCGYNEAVGYRAGTAQVFRLPGTDRMLELPLHVMDTALFLPARMALTQSAAYELVDKIMSDISMFGGVITLNWHCRSLGPERFWDDFYMRVLGELRARGAWFGTAEQVVRWFNKRRSAAFKARDVEESIWNICVSSGDRDDTPDLVLRIHIPTDGGERETRQGVKIKRIDIPLSGDGHQTISSFPIDRSNTSVSSSKYL